MYTNTHMPVPIPKKVNKEPQADAMQNAAGTRYRFAAACT
jgi:hypothetical protein